MLLVLSESLVARLPAFTLAVLARVLPVIATDLMVSLFIALSISARPRVLRSRTTVAVIAAVAIAPLRVARLLRTGTFAATIVAGTHILRSRTPIVATITLAMRGSSLPGARFLATPVLA